MSCFLLLLTRHRNREVGFVQRAAGNLQGPCPNPSQEEGDVLGIEGCQTPGTRPVRLFNWHRPEPAAEDREEPTHICKKRTVSDVFVGEIASMTGAGGLQKWEED